MVNIQTNRSLYGHQSEKDYTENIFYREQLYSSIHLSVHLEKNENVCVLIKSILSDIYWQNGISEKHERRMVIRGMDRNASGFLFYHGSSGPFGHFIIR